MPNGNFKITLDDCGNLDDCTKEPITISVDKETYDFAFEFFKLRYTDQFPKPITEEDKPTPKDVYGKDGLL